MKKVMMMIVATAMVTAVTHAATIRWGGDIGQGPGADWCGVGTMAYLVYVGTDTPIGSVSEWDIGTKLTNFGGTLVDSYALNPTDVGVNANFSVDWAGGEFISGGYYQIIVWDPTTPDAFGFYGKELPALGPTSPTEIFKLGNGSWDPGLYINPSQFPGGVIPEPTAMALLALGAAAVGLRRRFRK